MSQPRRLRTPGVPWLVLRPARARVGSADESGIDRAVVDAEALFDRLVERFRDDPGVTPPSQRKGGKFGASGLKADGKLFAMVSKGELVVKLPRARVEELVADRTGKPFDPGHGRVMKEWVTIAPRHARLWSGLADEARRFVGTAPQRSRRR